MVRLLCLGGLTLEGTDFKQKTPLLILLYVALRGSRMRSEIRDAFWPEQDDSELQQKNLSEALRRIRGIDPELIVAESKEVISAHVETDLEDFLLAYSEGKFEEAIDLYKGDFLEGVERETKLHLGLDLEEWILSERERLHEFYQEAQLRLAAQHARNEDFLQAAQLAWQVYQSRQGISYPTPEDYKRICQFLLAAEQGVKLNQVKRDAHRIYDHLNLDLDTVRVKEQLTCKFNLPQPTEGFVGRENDLERLKAAFGAASIISLVGFAGIGKTELTVSFAHNVAPSIRNGVYYISAEADLIAALGQLVSEGKETIVGLRSYFSAREALIIIDDAEEDLAQVKTLINGFRPCSGVKFIVCSRQVLNVIDETVIELAGLSYPEKVEGENLGEAGALFIASCESQGINVSDKENLSTRTKN